MKQQSDNRRLISDSVLSQQSTSYSYGDSIDDSVSCQQIASYSYDTCSSENNNNPVEPQMTGHEDDYSNLLSVEVRDYLSKIDEETFAKTLQLHRQQCLEQSPDIIEDPMVTRKFRFVHNNKLMYAACDVYKQVPVPDAITIPENLLRSIRRTNKNNNLRERSKIKKFSTSGRREYPLISNSHLSTTDIVEYFIKNFLLMIEMQFFNRKNGRSIKERQFHNLFVMNTFSFGRTKTPLRGPSSLFARYFGDLAPLILHPHVLKHEQVLMCLYFSKNSSKVCADLTRSATGHMMGASFMSQKSPPPLPPPLPPLPPPLLPLL